MSFLIGLLVGLTIGTAAFCAAATWLADVNNELDRVKLERDHAVKHWIGLSCSIGKYFPLGKIPKGIRSHRCLT
jgi:hypothetical protein